MADVVHMQIGKRFAVLLVLSVGVVAWVVIGLDDRGVVAPHGVATLEDAGHAPSASHEGSTHPGADLQRIAVSGAYRFRTVDRDGQPVASSTYRIVAAPRAATDSGGAAVAPGDRLRAPLLWQHKDPTSEDGRASIPTAAVELVVGGDAILRVGAAGFLTRDVGADELEPALRAVDAGDVVLRLEREPSVRFLIRDGDRGGGIAGAEVLVSTSPVEPQSAIERTEGVWRARTDARGMAEVSGVLRGSYFVRVLPPLPYAVAGGVRRTAMQLDDDVVRVDCRQMWLMAVSVPVGRRLVTFNAKCRNLTTRNGGQGNLAAAVEQYRARWPDTLVTVGFAKPRGTPVASYSVLVADEGWCDVEIQATPFRLDVRPVELAPEVDRPMTFADVRVEAVQASGGATSEPLAGLRLQLQSGGRPIPAMSVDAFSGRDLRLPVGSYRCAFLEYGLEKLSLPAVVVGAGDDAVDVTIRNRRPISLEVVDASGSAVQAGWLQVFDDSGGPEAGTKVYERGACDWGARAVWVPADRRLLVRAEVPGLGRGEAQLSKGQERCRLQLRP